MRRAMTVALVMACSPEERGECQEDERAVTLPDTVELVVGTEPVVAEVAKTPEQEDNLWAHRRCGLEAALIELETRGPHPVRLCNVVALVDLVHIRDNTVIAVFDDISGCDGVCEQCPTYGDALGVDAILYLLAGQIDVDPDQPVSGLGPAQP